MAGAKVTSVEGVEQMQAAMAAFVDDVRTALGAVEMETRRVVDWVERELPFYWRQEILKGRDTIAQAKADLARRRLQRTENYIPDTIEQEKALRRAVAWVEHCEAKLETIRKWKRELQRSVDEYTGMAGQLYGLVEGEPPRPVAALKRIVQALDAYLSLPAPTATPANELRSAALPASATESRPSDQPSTPPGNVVEHTDGP